MTEQLDDLFNFDDSVVKEWADAEVKTQGERKDVPDGNYEVKVEKCSAEVRKNRPTLNWHLRIVNGNHKGQMLFKTHYLDNATSRKVLKSELFACGLKLEDPRELKDVLPKVLDLRLKVHKKTQTDNPQFYNLYINQLLAAEQEVEGVDPEVGF